MTFQKGSGQSGQRIDVIGGIFDEMMPELTRGSFHCAVSIHHRLATEKSLRISDSYGEKLHPQIHLVDFDFCFTSCQIPVIDSDFFY